VIDGIDIIEHIARYNIKENKYACILSYVICDHLLSVLYLAIVYNIYEGKVELKK